ncbi:MAG: 50S ribosomal protein L20 [Deltaproteobacteria bacterium CG07_land_8_20_14_0_80_38_7]|nr:MAG: 50S ribosomal protein L20 [Deltaproteobacteria bacterium CG07_land_8_20_14_0_80_38_7]
MPRVKRGIVGTRRRKSILKQAKGYFGGRHRLLRTAMEAVDKANSYSYVGRKLKKRDFRALWQTRISAAAKENNTSYSRFIGNLKKKGVLLDRKILADLAISHPSDFAAIVSWTKAA